MTKLNWDRARAREFDRARKPEDRLVGSKAGGRYPWRCMKCGKRLSRQFPGGMYCRACIRGQAPG